MNRRKIKQKKIFRLVITVTIIVLLIISIVLPKSNFINKSFLKDIPITINKIIMYPFTALNEEKDVKHNESYLIQKYVNESLEKEIKELKEALELNRTLTEYKPINATILSRNKSYWYNTITIDKGKKDELECYEFKTRNFNNFTQLSEFESYVKIRYRSKPILCAQ